MITIDSNSMINLINMSSTVSNTKIAASALMESYSSKTSEKTDKTETSDKTASDPQYSKEMDYNEDGEVSINERIKYYTMQIADQITGKSSSANTSDSTNSSDKTSSDNKKNDETTGKTASNSEKTDWRTELKNSKAALNQKLIDAAYGYSEKAVGINIQSLAIRV